MELNVVSHLRTIFGHELATFKWKTNKELREELNCMPPKDGPSIVYEFDGEKLVAKDSEHHTTMESLDVSMYKGDDVSDQPTIEEGGMPVTGRSQRLKFPSQICFESIYNITCVQEG
ncbi:hypothetical protein LIER_28737 [Lithospermum erythrorhizon]|uniref:Uncharacterized protein n=1 Tax=Lithospermum erythrorhizon TaxID=34254 RepID=A0AAV3RKE0_LITER